MTDHRPPKGFLSGINIRYFMDCYEEWHAFVQGVCEVLCPWAPRHKTMNPILLQEIKDEHHYYVAGRVLGMSTWLFVIIPGLIAIIHRIVT